jgi:hypothetical protein
MKQKTTSCLLGMGLLAAVGLTYGAERFSYSNNGSEVTDIATGLKWKRCPEGMTWGGDACTGSATKYTHVGALQHAQTQASAGWRLPNVKELSSIADRSRANPAIDLTAFPNTPSDRFWSSSPYVGNSDYAWIVDFSDGGVSNNGRGNGNYVRLVR